MGNISGYSYVKINGTWYHLQNHCWDTKYNGTKESGGWYPLHTLAAVAHLCHGRISAISAATDVKPKGEGPADPGYFLPFSPRPEFFSKKMLRAIHNRLVKFGLVFPKRMGRGYLDGIGM